MRKNTILILLFSLLNSPFGNAQEKPIIINMENSITETKLSSVFNSVEFIKLETPPKVVLTSPVDIQFVGDRIIIFDGTRKVFIFSESGKFINQIGKFGRGPGEYILLMDMYVDKKEELIEILDYTTRKIIVYDFLGNHIIDHNGYQACSFGKDKDGNYLFFSEYHGLYGNGINKSDNIEVLLSNPQGKVLSTFKKDFSPL
ncbi:MAG: 6-bladed beta-propeller, partial [Bacteroidales bacterium]|nr:6-bladed beta-propeller [Bacteroidales bacterium]